MEHQAHFWSVNRLADEDMDIEEDKRSEGEIYSDGDNIEDRREKNYGEEYDIDIGESRRYDENRDRERPKDADRSRSKSSRRERSRDRRERDHKYKSKSSRRSPERKRSRSRDSTNRYDRKSRRHKHRIRHRRHTSSESRSSSRSGGRSRRRRSRSHTYDSYGSSEDSRDYCSDYYGDRGAQDKSNDSYKYQEPNSTVMVRGLASHLTEQDIRADILKCGIMIKDIRLIRHRDTGASRGFAFVEFHSVQEATRWMDMKMGSLVLQDEYHASLIYSVPKVPFNEKSRVVLSDWYCTKCQGHNFKRREFCYKCHNPRPEDQDPEFTEELSSHPTNTIILYNLDALTTEEGVLQAFKSRSSLASIPIRSVRIARESVTNLSRGMCYVETNNVADSIRLYTLLTQDTLTVDSREAGAAYSKPTSHSSVNSSVAATALAAAQWTNSGKSQVYDEETIEKMAQYSASLYAKTPEEHASYLTYYREYYRNQSSEGDTSKPGHHQGTEPTSSSSQVAVLKASSGSTASDSRRDEKDNKLTAQPNDVPDTSRYQYDEASGYYYDPVSGFYYDASTQYFYDSTKQQFLYWNSEQNKYVVVPDSASSSKESDTKKGGDKKKDRKPEKTDKVKVAKKIAKDMEKWAKTLNQKKDGFKPVFESITQNTAAPSEANTAEELPQYNYRLDMNLKQTNTTVNSSSKAQLVAPYADESDSEEEVLKPAAMTVNPFIPDALVDYNKLACLLCKRQFPNKEVLQKHTKLSDLHKKNLEELKKSNEKSFSDPSTTYRDRAKERRMKFGSDPDEGRNTLKDMYMQAKKDINLSYVEEPTKDGIKDDNVGNRMLQKMGWQEGQGLGKGNQGRTDIITTERRAPNAGLGVRGVPVIDDDDRYSRARKLTLARYQELE
ncbi:unnamed protein product [Allacma fusca]|uniref:RNA-binding protein 5 n=1 Tax=Allacma fusca TaxID=39272 RepID=A0A8J2NRE9_9HEXA|nr:unnamed protein product [Allacma fusca]